MHSPRRFALAGTLDEYGDIRARPRAMSAEPGSTQGSHNIHRAASSPSLEGDNSLFYRDGTALAGHPDLTLASMGYGTTRVYSIRILPYDSLSHPHKYPG
jgi:hypothetical protein